MADIVLINPRFEPSYWGLEHALDLLDVDANVPVAALPLLAALTPKDDTITLIDESVEEIDYDRCAKADIVGITGMIVQRFRMKEIIEELRKRGCFVVVGGPWVTVEEEYFGNLVDVIVIGEAEETWPQFLIEWKEGRHARRYEQKGKTDMSTIPLPRYDLLKMDRYAIGTVQFSRGCPFTCEFCDIIVTFGRRPRIKTSEQIIAELNCLWRVCGMDTAFIVDDNLIGNKKEIKKVLRDVCAWQQANDYPMMFFTEASLDLADDDELMQLMVDCNIRIVFVGVETPNEESLRETKKLQNLRKGGTIVEKIHMIQNAGMEVWSGHIVGFDNDGPDIFDRQIEFITQARIVSSMVGMLSAIPKTPLHKRLKDAGRLDVADEPEFGTNVIPIKMSRKELRDGFLRVNQTLYAADAYFERLDNLYLKGGLKQSSVRTNYLKKKNPVRRYALNSALLAEAAYITAKLQMQVKDKELRKTYRKVMSKVVRARPEPDVLQAYAIKCAMHYHAHRLTNEMASSGQMVNTF